MLTSIVAALLLLVGFGLQSSAGQSVIRTQPPQAGSPGIGGATRARSAIAPRPFVPSESVSSDRAVSFPVDI